MDKLINLVRNMKVEWKSLGEVCEIIKGQQLNKEKLLSNGKFPVINGGILSDSKRKA